MRDTMPSDSKTPRAASRREVEERPADFARPPLEISSEGAAADVLREKLSPRYQELLADELAEAPYPLRGDEESGAAPVAEPEPIPTSRKVTTAAALLLVAMAFTWFGKTLGNVITPVALAMFLAYLLVPMVSFTERRGVPRVIGYFFSSAVIIGFFVGVGTLVGASVSTFNANLEGYQENFAQMMETMTGFAQTIGVVRRGDTLQWHDLFEAISGGGVTSIISGGATYTFEFVVYFAATFILMMFMIWEAERFERRVLFAYPRDDAQRILKVIRSLNEDIQRYIILKVIISFVTAASAYGLMLFFQLEFAGVLAVIIFVANFVPYVGSAVATILPGIVALLQFASWNDALLLVALITVIQQLFGNVVEPRLQGRSLNVSPLIILLALAYFGWMWGIVGMVVSVPIAAGVRLIFDQFEVTKPYARLMSDI